MGWEGVLPRGGRLGHILEQGWGQASTENPSSLQWSLYHMQSQAQAPRQQHNGVWVSRQGPFQAKQLGRASWQRNSQGSMDWQMQGLLLTLRPNCSMLLQVLQCSSSLLRSWPSNKASCSSSSSTSRAAGNR